MLANHTYIGQNGKQNCMFPLEIMYLTQGEDTGSTHKGTYAMDFQGMYNASSRRYRCPYYAPCDLELVAIAGSGSHSYAYTSLNEVNFIDGTTGYFTIVVAHDNTSYSVGRRVMQGQELGKTGTYGQASGDHVHIEVKKGQYEGLEQNQYGYWRLKNANHLYDLLGVDDTLLLVTGGYNWQDFGTPPTPPTPSHFPKSKFPWVLYANKLRKKW